MRAHRTLRTPSETRTATRSAVTPSAVTPSAVTPSAVTARRVRQAESAVALGVIALVGWGSLACSSEQSGAGAADSNVVNGAGTSAAGQGSGTASMGATSQGGSGVNPGSGTAATSGSDATAGNGAGGSAAGEGAADDSAVGEPGAGGPATDDAAADDAATDDAATDDAATDDAATDDAATDDAATDEPVTVEPGTGSDLTGTTCAPGDLDCPCLADGACNGELECDAQSGSCVSPDTAVADPNPDAGVGGEQGGGAEPGDWSGFAATREHTGQDCMVPELPAPEQLPLIERLPDPFIKLDGTRMSQRGEWRCRRAELHEQAEKYIYGEKPPKPESVTGSVSDSEISVVVEHEGTRIEFSAQVVLPPGTGPFPAIINLGAKGGFGGITLGEQFVLDQGVAVIYYNHYDLGKEGPVEASRGLENPGLFYDIYGGFHSAGLLMSWAWGASRLLDVLQESGRDVIDPTAIGVTGCSRNGKGAFAVGVFDERIALTIPQETSTAGVPAYRIVDVLNTERTDHNFYGLNWLSNDFEPFVLNAAQLPVDSHEMIAMIAPRGLLVLDNPHLAQFSAPAGHTAAVAGLEMFTQLGVPEHLGYISAIENQSHCASGKPEYSEPLRRSIAKFLKREAAEPAGFDVAANGMGNIAEWVDWEAPTLTE